MSDIVLPSIIAIGRTAPAIRERLRADFPGISVHILQPGIRDLGVMQDRIDNADIMVTLDRQDSTDRIRAELALAICTHTPVWVHRHMLTPPAPGVRRVSLHGIRGFDNIHGLEDMDDLATSILCVAACEGDWEACRVCRFGDACPRQWS